jgi:flagellar hook protein FlgE
VLNVRRLGTAHIMTTYYVKTDANTWDVYAAADNKEIVSASVAAAVNSDPAARMRVPPTTTRYAIPRPTSVDCTRPVPMLLPRAMNTAASTPPALPRRSWTPAAAFSRSIRPPAAPSPADAGPDQCQAGAAITVPAVKAGTLLFTKNGALIRRRWRC